MFVVVFGSSGIGGNEPPNLDNIIDSSSDSATPESNNNSNGVTQQLQSFLDRMQRPSYTQSPKQQSSYSLYQAPQQTSKPVSSTAASNYSKIIQDAIGSGYSGYGRYSNRTVSRSNIKSRTSSKSSNIRRSQIQRSNNNVMSKEQQRKTEVSKYLTDYNSYSTSASKSNSRGGRSTRYSNSKSASLQARKKAEENRALATRRRLYGYWM